MNTQTFEPDFDADKSEEAGSTYDDFVKHPEDSELEDTKLLQAQFEQVMATNSCPKCGSKARGYEVTNSHDPDDMEASGQRAFCTNKKCGWKMELDW
jgi:hypothetical protein